MQGFQTRRPTGGLKAFAQVPKRDNSYRCLSTDSGDRSATGNPTEEFRAAKSANRANHGLFRIGISPSYRGSEMSIESRSMRIVQKTIHFETLLDNCLN
ncbi:hypothetical protein AMR42_05155 [Limnothrix sp. PR1529]|nr:hypothetical protein BCR12_15350 [Limnothrix sp. P13C2]PIB14561.1 hypothetical protein AMR42_05155 [Limnothrix sp. PR1529]